VTSKKELERAEYYEMHILFNEKDILDSYCDIKMERFFVLEGNKKAMSHSNIKKEDPEVTDAFYYALGLFDRLREIKAELRQKGEDGKVAVLNRLMKYGKVNEANLLDKTKRIDFNKIFDILELASSFTKRKRKKPKSTVIQQKKIKNNLYKSEETVAFLRRWGYDVETYERYIVAKHKDFSDVIFIKKANINCYRHYDKMNSRILTLEEFRNMILKRIAGKLGSSRIDVSKMMPPELMERNISYACLDYWSIFGRSMKPSKR